MGPLDFFWHLLGLLAPAAGVALLVCLAARVLLPDVVTHLVAELGSFGRILVGLPERHLLAAGSLRPGDDDFATLFADFVLEQSGGADEPIDRRVFELVDGRLVEFSGL